MNCLMFWKNCGEEEEANWQIPSILLFKQMQIMNFATFIKRITVISMTLINNFKH